MDDYIDPDVIQSVNEEQNDATERLFNNLVELSINAREGNDLNLAPIIETCLMLWETNGIFYEDVFDLLEDIKRKKL